jgi:hypothetical protein
MIRAAALRNSAALLGLIATLVGFAAPLVAQPAPDRLLVRRYEDGDRFRYRMTGRNDSTAYEVQLDATVAKNEADKFIEEYAWSSLVTNGVPRPLSPSAQAFRHAYTLEGTTPFAPPDLAKAPGLVGPVTDLMTFYADLFLAMHAGVLREPGDRFYFSSPMTASWADGNVVVLGEDAVDFDITLTEVDARRRVAILLVKHVPPPEPKIRLPADWMREAVADTPNNWVEVRKTARGFQASVGRETFDVQLEIALADGKILSAKMHNPVATITRDCMDEALTQCGEPRSVPILREVEMTLIVE